MKQRSTTPAHRRFMVRVTLICLAALLSVSVPVALVQRTFADQWDSQIASLQAQANQYQSQANSYKAQADTLQNKLDQINAQISALQADIAANQAKQQKLQADIAANQQKLQQAQSVLGDMLANLYVDDKVSAIELMASSKNISDFVDKQEYRTSVQDQLNSTIAQVKKLKAQLESDEKAVEEVLSQLNAQNAQLSAAQSQQQDLVNQTRGQEAAYQQLVSNAQSQMASVQSQQQAYYASLVRRGSAGANVVGSFQYWGWSGNQGCGGGYPYCQAQDHTVDPWGLYNRECVSYVAWAMATRYHKYVGNFSGAGTAYQWPSSAPAYSGAYQVGSPQPGDAVILPADGNFAPVGHAMLVEAVNGSDILVSQYNMYGTGEYSTMHIKPTGVIFLRFPNA